MRNRRRRHGLLLVAVLVLSLGGARAASAGETLCNGIGLPDEWPPRIDKLSREPMPVPYLQNRPEVIPIDVGRQLFVDDFLIEQTTLTRTFHAARYHPASPVVKPDRPWENDSMKGKPAKATAIVFGGGVWYDPADRLFKMWYMGSNLKRTCYATSRDGIRWEKPSLDIVPGTNILLDQERDSDTVWLDLNERDPARRYKMFTTVPRPEGDGFKPAIYHSADGIHWGKPLIVGGGIGDRTTIFYNPFRQRWVYSIRSLIEPWGRSRRYAECTDLVEGMRNLGRNAVLWLTADRLDPQNPHPAGKKMETGPQLYNLDVVPYESLLVGLFSIWQGKSGDDAEKRNEILVGYTRDGFHWHRPWRKPFAGVNETQGAWNWANVQSCASGCVVMGDELHFYVSGRGRTGEPASTGLAVLRRDGFASMDAGEQTGTLTTRPLTFKGKHLFVNADVSGGELRVEVLDREGKPIVGLGRNRCMPVTTDATLQPIQWMELRDLATVAGKPVRFRFHVTGGKLYSFWVTPDESGASNGYVAAGGPGFTSPTDTAGVAAYRAAAAIAASSIAATPTTRPGESVDGQWGCVLPHGPFSARDTAEDAVFAARMWLSNGWTPKDSRDPAAELTRDLWSSADGVNWTLVSDATPYDPYSEMVVFRDKLWAIKGSVWNSTDGVKWNKVLDHTPFGNRGYGEAVVFKERIWQLGSGEDVWSTADGVNWTCATPKAPYGNRAATAVAAFDGRLWLMGGRTEEANNPPEKGYKQFTTHNDVWSSVDGASWTREVQHAPWAPRQWAITVAYAGRLWLIGGHDNVNSRNLGDVWWTTDGRYWQRFESRPRFAPRHEVTPYVFNGSLWVVAGNTWPVVNDVWRLTLPSSAGAGGAR
ncbi:MAG: hypothetical protein HY718_13680 [Planctomycetes bacterium]|nr:hypothetical protein [Planctomycetota bacterium]